MKDQSAQSLNNMTMLFLDKVIEKDDLPGFIIRFAVQLEKRSYVQPREFFEKLSDFESAELAFIVAGAISYLVRKDVDDQKHYKDLYLATLCASLLARAEGKIEIVNDDLEEFIGGIVDLTRIHMLHRKGTIVANYENFTIFETNRPLFTLKPDQNEQAK